MFLKNIFCENILYENIFCENIFDENIFGKNIFDKNIFGENIFDENIFDENIFGGNVFDENIFGKNIFDENIFGNNIFLERDLTFPPTPCYPPSTYNSHPLLLLIWSWGGTNKRRTYGPDGRNDCSFYCIRFFWLSDSITIWIFWVQTAQIDKIWQYLAV